MSKVEHQKWDIRQDSPFDKIVEAASGLTISQDDAVTEHNALFDALVALRVVYKRCEEAFNLDACDCTEEDNPRCDICVAIEVAHKAGAIE